MLPFNGPVKGRVFIGPSFIILDFTESLTIIAQSVINIESVINTIGTYLIINSFNIFNHSTEANKTSFINLHNNLKNKKKCLDYSRNFQQCMEF